MITSRLKHYVKTDVVICMGYVSSSVSPSLAGTKDMGRTSSVWMNLVYL